MMVVLILPQDTVTDTAVTMTTIAVNAPTSTATVTVRIHHPYLVQKGRKRWGFKSRFVMG